MLFVFFCEPSGQHGHMLGGHRPLGLFYLYGGPLGITSTIFSGLNIRFTFSFNICNPLISTSNNLQLKTRVRAKRKQRQRLKIGIVRTGQEIKDYLPS